MTVPGLVARFGRVRSGKVTVPGFVVPRFVLLQTAMKSATVMESKTSQAQTYGETESGFKDSKPRHFVLGANEVDQTDSGTATP